MVTRRLLSAMRGGCLDFIYNKALMIIIDEEGIRLIGSESNDSESKDDEYGAY